MAKKIIITVLIFLLVFSGVQARTLRELNEEVVRQHLRSTGANPPGYFEPTPMYDDIISSGFRGNRGGWPHFDDDGVWCDDCQSYQ